MSHHQKVTFRANVRGNIVGYSAVWLALDDKDRIQGMWWRGCVQPFRKWKSAVEHFGWRAKHASLEVRVK